MPRFRFRAPDGKVRSRSTSVNDPGYTHAVLENMKPENPIYASGWQLTFPCCNENEAKMRVAAILQARPSAELVIATRLIEEEEIFAATFRGMVADATSVFCEYDHVVEVSRHIR